MNYENRLDVNESHLENLSSRIHFQIINIPKIVLKNLSFTKLQKLK